MAIIAMPPAPPTRQRALALGLLLLAAAGTALAIVLANWWIAGGQIGMMIGLAPWDSIPRLGWSYAWTLSSLANGGAELVWYAVALVVAAVAGR